MDTYARSADDCSRAHASDYQLTRLQYSDDDTAAVDARDYSETHSRQRMAPAFTMHLRTGHDDSVSYQALLRPDADLPADTRVVRANLKLCDKYERRAKRRQRRAH